MKIIVCCIIFILINGFSCKGNKDAESSYFNTKKENESLIVDSTDKKAEDYLIIDTNVCIDNSRRISPVNGYLKIGINIPTVKIETYFDTTKILEGLQYINIIDSAYDKLIQRIDASDVKLNNIQNDNSISFTELHFNYYNLDDYIDIYFLQDCGAHGSCSGYYFLYDVKKGKYVFAKEYENLYDVSVNKKKNLIYSVYNSGGGYWTCRTFRIKGGKLYLVEEESLEPIDTEDNSELYRYILRKRNYEGKLVKVKAIDTSQLIGPIYLKKD